ncbi:K+ channel tetramerisation domain protein [Ancylostoma ceylanicum]|uniref:K+ channel tetramerisation domain protein n=1 Tax=Ancylostoma ceylanicum TaxID=53326 RepID=A0A0D6LZW4_9BILA|nr:K+ channel tetramerisation domain protein [Ancylostoma ceylanicum]
MFCVARTKKYVMTHGIAEDFATTGGDERYKRVRYVDSAKRSHQKCVVVVTDSDGFVLIDRSGQYFGTILNYLRDGTVSLPCSRLELEQIHAEAQFYCVKDLEEQCRMLLEMRQQQRGLGTDTPRPIYLCLSKNETEELLKHLGAVVLSIRRETGYDFETLDGLKKNEVFLHKLAEKYSNHILFIQESVSDSTYRCEWFFYTKRKHEFVQSATIQGGVRAWDGERHVTKIMEKFLDLFISKEDCICTRCGQELCAEHNSEGTEKPG